jgi:SAM-dependent methyltransferase
MSTIDELRKTTMAHAQGAMSLHVAFIGVANGLLTAFGGGPASTEDVARRLSLDPAYVTRWAEAAFAFGYLDVRDARDADAQSPRFETTELGRAFFPDAPGTLMPFAVQSALGAHMAERAAALMRTGERPGESALAERETILPWFGPMLEATFGPLFERDVLPKIGAFEEAAARGGLVVDLGCGNGWYLRRIAARFPGVRGVGLDGFAENVRQANERAAAEGLGARLAFHEGDIYAHAPLEPASIVAMNRALHHVWDQRDRVFRLLHDALEPGGAALIWEPAWPADITRLRDPRGRGLAMQNLSEHVQGNHFLRPDEIEAAFRAVGMQAETHLFGDGFEALVIGRRAR